MLGILITGAASGIGRETARRFAREGWRVGLLDVDAAALQALSAELGGAFSRVIDVRHYADVVAAVDAFAVGGMELLFNSHGILRCGRFEDISAEEHRRTIEINVIGVMNTCHAAFRHLRGRPGAQIISMCSASAGYGVPQFASYSASKFAVRGLTEALQIEWGKHGIRVTDIVPPFVSTPMVADQAVVPAIIARMGVNLGPGEIAEAVWKQYQSGPTHRPVGLQYTLLYWLGTITPPPLQRVMMRWLSRE